VRVVVDTGIIFSSLLSHSAEQRKILFNREYKFYSPNFVFLEIFKHKEKILKHTKTSEAEVFEYLISILRKIHFMNEEIISIDNRMIAYELCKDVDRNDTPFVALALELDAYLWSSDKKLIKGLKKKGTTDF
jgi:predicted nucleic acid-binding protein